MPTQRAEGTVQCLGCFREFAPQAYGRHIAQSRNPACAAIYHRNGLTYAELFPEVIQPNSAAAESEADVPMGDPDLDDPPRPFLGDYFGIADEYTARDFGWMEGEGERDFEGTPGGSFGGQGRGGEDEHEEIIVPHVQPPNDSGVTAMPNAEVNVQASSSATLRSHCPPNAT